MHICGHYYRICLNGFFPINSIPDPFLQLLFPDFFNTFLLKCAITFSVIMDLREGTRGSHKLPYRYINLSLSLSLFKQQDPPHGKPYTHSVCFLLSLLLILFSSSTRRNSQDKKLKTNGRRRFSLKSSFSS